MSATEGAGGAASVRAVRPARGPLRGSVRVPGDKSIAHRAVIFNSLGAGVARVGGLPEGEDVASSIAVMRALGAAIGEDPQRGGAGAPLLIEGRAMRLRAPAAALQCGNSGTTMRLLMGALAGQRFESALAGDASLSRRPMERVAAPLRAMGAAIATTDGHAPVRVGPASLVAADHDLAVASAQIKTALLLAALQAHGRTRVREPQRSRDHTERMLAAMGVAIERDGLAICVDGPVTPECVDVDVPGDPSSAAFFAVAAAIVPRSEVLVEHVCLNPTRTGFVNVLRRMGVDVEATQKGEVGGEPVGDLRVRAAGLHATRIEGDEIPATIDELPVLAVAAAAADGVSVIADAGELRVKESDRIAAVARSLRALGVRVEEHDDGMTIHGGSLVGGRIESMGDHRIAMSAAVAAMVAAGAVEIDGASAAAVSFPGFFEMLEGMS